MSVYCDEQADVWNERRVKARKEHTCSACRETVRKGDRYVRDAMLSDGDWSVVIRCERCELIFDHLQERMAGTDECADRELDCGHDYEERWGEDPPEWLAALAFWVPGDPLPATHACVSLREMLYWIPYCKQTRVCTDDVPSSYWDCRYVERYGYCASTQHKYELRTGNRIAVPVKGNPAHTEPCS